MSQQITQIFFDLDDTLYPFESGVWQAISRRIDRYLIEHRNLTPQAAQEARARYGRNFGTTLTGLMSEGTIDPGHYLRYVHAIDLDRLLSPDARLRDILTRIHAQKVVFTNASRAHAEKVTECLRIRDQFRRIIAIEDLGFTNKPEPIAYEIALQLTSNPPPGECLIVDDRVRNLAPAGSMGMRTVLVGVHDGSEAYQPDITIGSAHELLRAIPDLAGIESDGHARD